LVADAFGAARAGSFGAVTLADEAVALVLGLPPEDVGVALAASSTVTPGGGSACAGAMLVAAL